MSNATPHIIVVGAGIVGASIAWHLVRRGARVTIVTADAPGGVATPNSLSWINSNHRFPPHYFALRHRSMAEWRRLKEALPDLQVRQEGSVYFPCEDLDIEAFIAAHSARGYRIRAIDQAELNRLEPGLRITTDIAARAEDEGAAEASDAARHLVEAAVGEGATLINETAVDRLHVSGVCIAGVVTGDDVIAADEVVVAAGVATPDLLASADIDLPMTAPSGLLAHTKPIPPLLNGIILADSLHFRQKLDGSLIGGAGYEGSKPGSDPEGIARELMRRMNESIDPAITLELDFYTVGYRPTPPKGFPIVGRPPGTEGLMVAVMHSGVTLAPIVGRLVTEELLEGTRDGLLRPFGVEQYAEAAE